MAGAKRCLLSLDTLRKRTGKLMATERQAQEIADDIVESTKRAWRMAHPSSSDGAAGPAESWRMALPSSSDEDDGSKQRAWTKTKKALRHFAADRVAGKKLMERGFLRRMAHPTSRWRRWIQAASLDKEMESPTAFCRGQG